MILHIVAQVLIETTPYHQIVQADNAYHIVTYCYIICTISNRAMQLLQLSCNAILQQITYYSDILLYVIVIRARVFIMCWCIEKVRFILFHIIISNNITSQTHMASIYFVIPSSILVIHTHNELPLYYLTLLWTISVRRMSFSTDSSTGGRHYLGYVCFTIVRVV